MRRVISLLVALAMTVPLYACENNSKETLYQQFVTLVESERYKEAIDLWLEEYDNYSTGSYDDFKEEYFAYKDFEDYFTYASALSDYVDVECKSLSCLEELKKVSPSFLNVDKYITEIENILDRFEGIWESSVDDTSIFHYIIVRDGNIWLANGLSMSDLGKADIVNHDIILENNLSVDEFCAKESSWCIWFQDGMYMAGNTSVKDKSNCIIEFSLVDTQMIALATGDRYNMFNGTYCKIQ